MAAWSHRLQPEKFSILGGEPTVNRELLDIVAAAIEHWPESEIRVVTNGFLLHRHPMLPEVMVKARRSILVVSSHYSGAEYQAKFAPVRALISDWQSRYGLNARIVEADRFWTRRYRSGPAGVEFFSSEPEKAWNACVGKYCIQLFDGCVWKCPPVTYLQLLTRVQPKNDEARTRSSTYLPLESTCTPAELEEFFSRKQEPICAMCPEKPQHFELRSPLTRQI